MNSLLGHIRIILRNSALILFLNYKIIIQMLFLNYTKKEIPNINFRCKRHKIIGWNLSLNSNLVT